MWIDEWRNALKFLSVQVQAIVAAIMSTWLLLGEQQQLQIAEYLSQYVPGLSKGNLPAIVTLIGVAATVMARLRSQPKLHEDDPQ